MQLKSSIYEKEDGLQKKSEDILLGMGLEAPLLEIDVSPDGRFGGFVISESFTGKSQIERQDMLWDSVLDEEKNLKIIGLLTMTPAEVEADSYS